ncbi:MAG: phage tail protein [Anaerovoracaceae bacterium]|jgi:hypothetical protein
MATVNLVTVGKPAAGMISVAPLGTALPTDASTALPSEYESLGFISEDGVTNNNSPDSDTIKDWEGKVVYTVQNEKSDTWSCKFIEAMNTSVLKVIYGEDNVTETNGVTEVKANADEPVAHVYVIDEIFNGDVPHRTVIPHGVVTEIGDITHANGEVLGFETTIQALPDDDGYTHYEYTGTTTTTT